MIYTTYRRDIGARESQQDSVDIIKDKDNILMVIGDGMGGHTGGAKASEILINISKRAFCGNNYKNPEEFFNSVIATSYKEITIFSEESGEDPNTTASFALLKGNTIHYGYIGDTRIYIFDKNGLITRTRDDSVPEILYQLGEIKEEEIATHHEQNKLTKSLGSYKLNRVFYRNYTLKENKEYMVIVCSDGFWTQISNAEMHTLFTVEEMDINRKLEELIELSKQRAGDRADNISIAFTKIYGVVEERTIFKNILTILSKIFKRG